MQILCAVGVVTKQARFEGSTVKWYVDAPVKWTTLRIDPTSSVRFHNIETL